MARAKWFGLALLALGLLLGTVETAWAQNVKIPEFSVQPSSGGFKHTMPVNRDNKLIKIKWPETADKLNLSVRWVAIPPRLVSMKMYRNSEEIKNLGVNRDIRASTFKQQDGSKVDCDEYKKTFPIQLLGKRDFTVRVDVVQIGTWDVLKSFTIRYIVPKAMSYHLRQSLKAIFDFHQNGSKAHKYFQHSRKTRADLIKKLRSDLSKAEEILKRKKVDFASSRKALVEKYQEEIKRLKQELKVRKGEITRKDSSIDTKDKRILALKTKISNLEELLKDQTPPTIEITYPNEREGRLYIARNSNISLRGMVRDASEVKWVKVGDKTVKTKKVFLSNGQASGVSFQKGLKLYDGFNFIDVYACDNAGNIMVETMVITVRGEKDTKPPVITIKSPGKRYHTNRDKVEVIGRADDNIAVDRVTIQGREANLSKNDFSGPTSLEMGVNKVKIVAYDKAKNRSEKVITIIRDEKKPLITIAQPDFPFVYFNRVKVSGKIDETYLESVTVNGTKAKFDGQGNFTAEVEVDTNTRQLAVKAVDKAGNTTTATTKVQYKPRVSGDDPFEDNDTRTTAHIIYPGNYEDMVCKDDDWFKINIKKPSILRIRMFFQHTSKQDLELKVFDEDGKIVNKSTSTISNEMMDHLVEEPTTLYIHIYGYKKSKNTYKMFVKLIPIAQPAPGLKYEGQNPQGLHYYTHEKTGMKMVLIPGGKFWMGTPNTSSNKNPDEGPYHGVYLDSYLIGQYEVRQKIWKKIMGANPSSNKRSEDLPVEMTSWKKAMEFCRKTGLTLPTEAQWERACRAELKPSKKYAAEYYWGDRMNGQYLWYAMNSNFQTHPVGQKLPNKFGLYDMLGNVREWCLDSYGPYASNVKLQRNPLKKGGKERVNRGGGMGTPAQNCRCATRFKSEPSRRSFMIGFRVTLNIKD